MPTLTFDPSEDAPSTDQMAAEAAALAQGEKLQEAFQQDRARKYDQTDQENSDVNLIGGKFKSQEELLKAYQELQQKLSKGETLDEDEEAPEGEEAPQAEEQAEEAPADEATVSLTKAADEYQKTGQISEEAIEELSKLDSKELIKAYVDFYTQNASRYQQQAEIQAADQQQILAAAGGPEAYGEMVQWAAQNLDPQEIDAFNSITNSGNVPAIKFAVEALQNRYKAAEGYEAPMVSGKRGKTAPAGYRSHAELARDIADPRYSSDPAFRADVEAKLARSKDLL